MVRNLPLPLPDLSDKGKDLPKDMWDPLPSDDDDSEEAKKKRATNIQPWMQQARLRDDDTLWGYNWSGDYGNFFRHSYSPSTGSQAGAPAGSWYGWQSPEDAGDSPRKWADWEFYDDQPPLPDELAPDEPDPWQPIPDLDKGWDSFLSNAQRLHDEGAARDAASRSKYNSELAAAKRRLAAAETDDDKKAAKAAVANAQSGIDFLNKYQVYKGGRPLVEGYGEEQWKGEALKGDWSDFYQPVEEPIGDTTGEVDIYRGREDAIAKSEAETDQSPIDYDLGGRAGAKQRIDRIKEIESLQDNLARETKQQKLAQETGTAIRQLETDQRSSEPTLAERLADLDQTIADNTYTTGDKIKDFFGGLDVRNALEPENYGDVADAINKGTNKVWDFLEAPAQGSSKIKEAQDWLWNETPIGTAKDRLLDEPLSTALGWIGQEDKAPAGRKFIDYLLGDTTTQFSQQEIDDTFRGMSTADGIVNTSGGIGPEVYGSEDISQLSYTPDPEGKGPGTVTTKIGYEFKKDVDEATGRYDDNWSQGLNKLSRSIIQPLQGQYATDVGPHLPVIGSPAIQLSRILGGAHDSKQEITGSFDLLNPQMKKAVKDQYNRRQLQSQPKRNNRAMSGKSIGNIGGRKLFKLPSISNNILAN